MHAPNRLAAEGSLYLRMHAHNPVDWYPWGDEALRRARALDRPIFLSSGYASCHWCHVMEREVFEDAEVAALLNRHFVCIKVDREERPDVDATYMQAAMLLTGGGGWPLSVFLTPTLEPFHAATYVPRDPFLALLARIVAVHRDRPADLRGQAAQLTARVLAVPQLPTPDGDDLDDGLIAAAVAAARDGFDAEHGGFASRQKFPVPVRWRFLLHRWRQCGDLAAGTMVDKTLQAMAQGGLRDHLAGGFHRYTVDAHWTVPHFEKMLYDNAQLAALFLEAGAALERPEFTAVGAESARLPPPRHARRGGGVLRQLRRRQRRRGGQLLRLDARGDRRRARRDRRFRGGGPAGRHAGRQLRERRQRADAAGRSGARRRAPRPRAGRGRRSAAAQPRDLARVSGRPGRAGPRPQDRHLLERPGDLRLRRRLRHDRSACLPRRGTGRRHRTCGRTTAGTTAPSPAPPPRAAPRGRGFSTTTPSWRPASWISSR